MATCTGAELMGMSRRFGVRVMLPPARGPLSAIGSVRDAPLRSARHPSGGRAMQDGPPAKNQAHPHRGGERQSSLYVRPKKIRETCACHAQNGKSVGANSLGNPLSPAVALRAAMSPRYLPLTLRRLGTRHRPGQSGPVDTGRRDVACWVLLACSARKAFGVEDQRVVAFRLDPATVGESAERLVC